MVSWASINTIKQKLKTVFKSRGKKSDKVKANTNVFGVMDNQKMSSIIVMDKSMNAVGLEMSCYTSTKFYTKGVYFG